MQDHERFLQILGTLVLVAFSSLLFMVRYVKRINGAWRDAIILAALFNLTNVIVRVYVLLGRIPQGDAHTLNGLIASVFVAALITAIIGHLVGERRCRDIARVPRS